jgi:hypothetical protein
MATQTFSPIRANELDGLLDELMRRGARVVSTSSYGAAPHALSVVYPLGVPLPTVELRSYASVRYHGQVLGSFYHLATSWWVIDLDGRYIQVDPHCLDASVDGVRLHVSPSAPVPYNASTHGSYAAMPHGYWGVDPIGGQNDAPPAPKPKKVIPEVCPACGDAGEWRMLALVCRKGHGKFQG